MSKTILLISIIFSIGCGLVAYSETKKRDKNEITIPPQPDPTHQNCEKIDAFGKSVHMYRCHIEQDGKVCIIVRKFPSELEMQCYDF